MVDMPNQYYNRFDPDDNYEEHLFIAGRPMQSAEFNELQKAASHKLRGVADALFKDGDIIRDAGVIVDSETGDVSCQSGAVYISGAVRGVPPADLVIPVVGEVAVGIRLISTVVTALQDPGLLDPATGTRAFNEAGAERLKVDAVWSWSGDEDVGEFFPVYSVVDGLLGAKEAPPNLDAVTQALARYDRDSAGGTYIVSGLGLSKLADDGDNQAYTMAEGRARVYGYPIEFTTSRRIILDAAADLKTINNEPKSSTTADAQRVNLARTPAKDIISVSITAEKTVSVTHGVFTGAQDPLPDASVLEILEVSQGATTYVETTDYLLTDGKVDWTPAGDEPAPGSTYSVTYRYITLVTPTAVDSTGYTVTGAVVGTLILTTYRQMLPRIDRLCLNADGQTQWLVGVSAEYNPQPPAVPSDLLSLASVYQTWDANRRVVNDGVRVVPMPVLAGIENRMDLLMQLIAQQRLESNIHTRESGTKKGLFTDPFIDDSQRDAGTPQTAAIVNGELMLSIDATISPLGSDITSPQSCAFTQAVALEQTLITGEMKINPYMAFGAVPALASLTPAVDRWTVSETVWAGPSTSRFVVGSGDQSSITTQNRNVLLQATTIPVETLREIEISFSVTGFGGGEILTQVTFDGIVVAPSAL